MVQVKRMNENSFAKLVKELDALGELIRTRQDEKQAVINEFGKEKVRFKNGRISEDTMKSSVRKTNNEFVRINKNIRDAISKSNKLGMRIREFISNQSPRVFVAKVSGISLKQSGKKKVVKKISSKK